MLQRVLGAHPSIHTLSEPWVLLPAMFGLQSDEVYAPYNHALARTAIEQFQQALPGGREDYLEATRKMFSHLYSRALERTPGATFFLDKTPRYYFVLEEIRQLFPQGTVIHLLRNPLAVLFSIVRTWTPSSRRLLYRWRHDLLDGPRCLAESLERLGDSAVVVRYESLVADPATEVRRLCDVLGLTFDPEMIEDSHQPHPGWPFGDQDHAKGRRPRADRGSDWTQLPCDPELRRWGVEYVQLLGRDVLTTLGYLPHTLIEQLDAVPAMDADDDTGRSLFEILTKPTPTTVDHDILYVNAGRIGPLIERGLTLDVELRKTRATLEHVRGQRDQIMGSISYKLGRALTWPVRAVRKTGGAPRQ